ncbi:hypothetical protein [Mucilaginibacter gilvus]|uniref:hypothetical protein n=1 Tax=Mucilaginibacter gilvus TaxID=2305909 RepID=UPI001419C308|nr:hypothetical protein [Mucilaginibacter gilvus]
MKTPVHYLLLAAFALPLAVCAQSKNDKPVLQLPPAAVVVDGKLNEWGDSLRYISEEKKIPYTIANDKDNIYVVVRISDRSEQRRALMAGITFSIDPKGKKKEAFSVTFPYTNPEAIPAERIMPQPADAGQPQPGSEDDRQERMEASLTRLKQIKATGFADVLNEVMTTANLYGIKTALGFDQDSYLVYEAAVPIAMLHADNADKNEWAFNIKINGITRPKQGDKPEGGGMGGGRGGRGSGMSGGGRGGMGGGGGRRGGGMSGGAGGNTVDRSEITKTVDFWEKFYLAGK